MISATGSVRHAERRRVAMQRPNWTAGRISLTRSPSEATVASRSGATKASPQKKAGRRSPWARSIASEGSCTTSRMVAPRRKNACRGAPAGVGCFAEAAQVETSALKRSDRAIESRRDRDHVVEHGDAVGMHGLLAWRWAIGPRGRQPVQLGGLDIAKRPASEPFARVAPSQADPGASDDAGVVGDLESACPPCIRRIRDRQLIERRIHALAGVRHGAITTRPKACRLSRYAWAAAASASAKDLSISTCRSPPATRPIKSAIIG